MFLERALAIEVIRRTFADDFDIESADPLSIAQLTPLIDTPLLTFDAEHREPGPQSRVPTAPSTSREKLAGLRLNHFAGFYRSSWRANDFMWGRLDGAAAVARLLVDQNRARDLHALPRLPSLEPAAQLARALVPDGSQLGDSDRVHLLFELVPAAAAEINLGDTAARAELEGQVRDAIAADLSTGKGELTRAICARALQYAALRDEAPVLAAQSGVDRRDGAYSTELGWTVSDDADSFWPVIMAMRQASNAKSIPSLLGCDKPDESTSTLGLRTLSQTMLVALAALTGALPLAKFLQPVRLPLLAIQGATARRRLDRFMVVLGFAGASWYLAARWMTIPRHPAHTVPLHAIWSPEVLALVVSFLAVGGVVAVPTLRAARTKQQWRRLWQGLIAAALAASAGAVALIWQWHAKGTSEALTAWGARYDPPAKLLWVVVAAGGFQVASSLDTVLRFIRPLLPAIRKHVSTLALILGGIGGTLAGYTAVKALGPQVTHGGMRTMVAVLAFAGPVLVTSYLGLRRRTRSIWARLGRWLLPQAVRFSAKVVRLKSAPSRAAGWCRRKIGSIFRR